MKRRHVDFSLRVSSSGDVFICTPFYVWVWDRVLADGIARIEQAKREDPSLVMDKSRGRVVLYRGIWHWEKKLRRLRRRLIVFIKYGSLHDMREFTVAAARFKSLIRRYDIKLIDPISWKQSRDGAYITLPWEIRNANPKPQTKIYPD